MTTEISWIDHYYHSAKGRLFAELFRAQILEHLQPPQHILTIGFGYPYICLPSAQSCPVLVPSEMGAIAWPDVSGIMSATIESDSWPLVNDSVGQIVISHGLEFTYDPEACLSEANRVLEGSGKLLLIVPNRRSLWVRRDDSPLGHGRPFSRLQLTKLVTNAGFEVTCVKRLLFLPPVGLNLPYRLARLFDKFGQILWSMFGGVLVVEATKLVYASPKKIQHRPIPALSSWIGASAIEPHPTATNHTSKHVSHHR